MKQIFPLAAALILASGTLLGATESLQLDANENLFYVLAAINVAGYDDGMNLPDANPIRKQLVDYLKSQNLPVAPKLADFYARHGKRKTATQDLSQYISWALSVGSAPDFKWKGRDVEVPPDAREISDFASLMSEFYTQAKLDQLWDKVQPVYQKELERYHSPVVEMTTQVKSYLRTPAAGYLGRHFEIFIDLLGAPEQVQTRNYGSDAFVIVTPAANLPLFDIRHAYLHYEIDPVVIKYGLDLDSKRSLIDFVQLAPLDANYKSDFVMLANESLIKAVECRLDKNKAGVDQALHQGYILVPNFFEHLPLYESQQQSMRFYAEEMIAAIDPKKETARLNGVKFDSATLQRAARQVQTPSAQPELSVAGKTVAQAEDLYTERKLDKAKDLYLKSLEQKGPSSDHALAWYGLARIAVLENQPDNAIKMFDKTLGSSPDPQTRAWAYVYLARLARAAREPENAQKFYQEALAVQGASERALEAARKESQSIPKNQEILK